VSSDGSDGSVLVANTTNTVNATPTIYGVSSGAGPALFGYQAKPDNQAVAVRGTNTGKGTGMFGDDGAVGTGIAIQGLVDNPNNASPGILSQSRGSGPAVQGDDAKSGTGPAILATIGNPSNGSPAVSAVNYATGPGVSATGATGVIEGVGNTGSGVHAVAGAGGVGLTVDGRCKFSNAGVVTIAARARAVTVKALLTPTSIVLAMLQTNAPGVWIQSAVPDFKHATIKITLNKPAPTSLKVGWFALN
jgi:hypothetical protein